MTWEDAGDYTIRVQNRYGFATKSLTLQVSDPPTFLQTPKKSYHMNRLDQLRLSVRVDGIPFPKVRRPNHLMADCVYGNLRLLACTSDTT